MLIAERLKHKGLRERKETDPKLEFVVGFYFFIGTISLSGAYSLFLINGDC